jgi:hypothetical protein
MGILDKRPSRMQGQVFFEVRRGGRRFFGRVHKRIEIFLGGCPRDCRSWSLGLIPTETPPLKVHRGSLILAI